MKLISSLIASFLAFAYAQNTTMDTTTEEPTTTYQMNISSTITYSTTTMEPTTTEEIVFEEVIPDKGSKDPETEFGCDYEWEGSLSTENIDITICGFTEVIENDDDTTTETEYVAIELDLPSERWTAFAIQAGELDSEDGFSNYMGYNIIIPIYSNKIDEIYYESDKTAIDLENTIEIYSDEINLFQRRLIKLIRPKTVGYEHLNNTFENLNNAEVEKLYFDFANFDECSDSVIISVQYGSEDGSRFKQYGSIISDNYQYRQASTEDLDEVDGEECVSDTDTDTDPDYAQASTVTIFGSLIIGFIAMLV